jgi:hypothetical protein
MQGNMWLRGSCECPAPHGEQASGRQHVHLSIPGGDRERRVGLAESDVVGEERAAEPAECPKKSCDRLLLMRKEGDVAKGIGHWSGEYGARHGALQVVQRHG